VTERGSGGIERALDLAYRYLNRRERTVAEARGHLLEREVDPRCAEEAVATLIDQGYLDDRRFAHLFVQDKRELQQWGDERIRRGLEGRGIDPEQTEEAISQGTGPGDELDRALAILRRRLPAPGRGRRDRERALGLLLRRGYQYELADTAVRSHLGEASLPASTNG
jgi:regulatory protein